MAKAVESHAVVPGLMLRVILISWEGCPARIAPFLQQKLLLYM